ncbi:unnamed protein product [Lactuca saligna]|uniref:Harbinger transposase-derived protein n=1 Tax=Lactuca saligna TaxID=75948 RepID=A0AA36E4B8_LACSI|nr:unnamed protein product [Lactuca saligna]
MSERTTRESLYTLSKGVVEIFGDVYLRKPSLHDLQELYVAHKERHGFPGMIGSIDCTHWKWKIYPIALKGQYVPDAPFTVNENEYKYGYYLTDGIYPQYSRFVKAFCHPIEERDNFFKTRQERAHKGCETCFWSVEAAYPESVALLPTFLNSGDQQFHCEGGDFLRHWIQPGGLPCHPSFNASLLSFIERVSTEWLSRALQIFSMFVL